MSSPDDRVEEGQQRQKKKKKKAKKISKEERCGCLDELSLGCKYKVQVHLGDK
jgi:hypothetical protein